MFNIINFEFDLYDNRSINVIKSFLYDFVLYITVPFQIFSICFFLFVINNFELTTYELVGKVLSMGILCGHAINIAHELGHRSNKFEKLYRTRNLAIKKSKGKYICFLDTDDFWSKNKLSSQINLIKRKNEKQEGS